MSFKRSTAAMLATVAMTLGAGGPAFAMPARDAGVDNGAPPVFVETAGPSTGDGGVDTLAVVLLSTGALLAGAAVGFGGARASAVRTPLHPS